MRRPGLLFSLALIAGLVAVSAQDFRLAGVSGGALTPATLSQGDTVVIVWAGWSPRCRDLSTRIQKLRKALPGQAKIVTVNFQESDDEVKAYLARSPLGVPTYLDRDGRFSKSHAVAALPGVLVFRQGKKVLKSTLGADSERAIRAALGS